MNWIDYAAEELGQAERPGKPFNPRIVEYAQKLGLKWYNSDEVAWCAIFIGWCLERAGLPSTRSAAARSYEKYGTKLAEPVPGCIAVLNRPGGAHWMGHVGFFLKKEGNRILLLGGNQSDKVSKAWFDASRVVAYVWPPGAALPKLELQDDTKDDGSETTDR